MECFGPSVEPVVQPMTETESTADNRSGVQIGNYLHQLADVHGISGYTKSREGTVVYAACSDGEYDLHTPESQLPDTEGALRDLEWLQAREKILAYRDEASTEQFDLPEVDLKTETVTPILDDEIVNFRARQHPTDPDRVPSMANSKIHIRTSAHRNHYIIGS